MADNKLYNLVEKNKSLASDIDKLYQVWFDPTSHEIKKNDDNVEHVDESLDKLTIIVRQLKQTLINDKSNRDAQDALSDIEDFINGDAGAALSLMKNRDRDDHICKLVWLINLTTPVAVLSKEIKAAEKPLDKGPLRKRNITSQNVEHAVVAIPNSKQMKSPTKFLSDVLPDSFAAIAKNKAAAKAASRRSAFSGSEYHNIATMDSLYQDIGSALVFVSTAIFAEVNRAFTENGKRQSAEKLANVDFSSLSPNEREVMMGTLTAGFRKYSNYTGELETFSNLSEKMTLDAALRTYYEFLNDAQKKESGFTEDQLMSLPYARAFAKKYHTQFKASYDRYMNKFLDGVLEALKKEQETLEKEWFENKITGERVYRRGRLAGHGLKFMSTGPMKWLDGKLGEKQWNSLWLVPKLGMGVLKVLTNPAVHKARNKLFSLLVGTVRTFAQGFKESFDATGRSSEITFDEVEKVIKENINKLRKIKNDKKIVTAESLASSNDNMLIEAEDDDLNKQHLTVSESDYQKCNTVFDKVITALKAAISEEATKQDIDIIDSELSQLDDNTSIVSEILNADDSIEFESDEVADDKLLELRDKVVTIRNLRAKYEDVAETRNKLDKGNASDKADGSDQSIEVGEKTVQICEQVFEVVNKYLARQWNLLALHSTHADMPLCAMYQPISTPNYIKRAAKPANYDNQLKKQRAEEKIANGETKRAVDKAARQQSYEAEREAARAESKVRYEDERTEESLHANLLNDLHAWLLEKSDNSSNEFMQSDDVTARNKSIYADSQEGNATAEYPTKTGNEYHYHGLSLQQASGSDKNGFGVFAERIAKLAPLLVEFESEVKILGDQSAEKSFDNSGKDEYVNPLADSYVTPEELLADDPLNEDLFNRIFKKTDKAADKVGDLAKKPIKGLGGVAGKVIGKAFHGITHTSTADKDRNVAKTIEDNIELTYTFSKKLKLSYLKDGATIIGKHCLNAVASKEFDNINTLVEALAAANIPNSRSISSITAAVKSFASDINGVQFKPCRTVIDYELADKINTGALTDSDDSADNGHIKGFYIGNFEATRNTFRPVSDADQLEMQNQSELENADTIDEEPAVDSTKTVASADATADKAHSDISGQIDTPEEYLNRAKDSGKATTIQTDNTSNKAEDLDNMTVKAATNNVKLTPAAEEKIKSDKAKRKLANGYQNAKSISLKGAMKQGYSKRDVLDFAKSKGIRVKESVDIKTLSNRLSEINNIDWKDIL